MMSFSHETTPEIPASVDSKTCPVMQVIQNNKHRADITPLFFLDAAGGTKMEKWTFALA